MKSSLLLASLVLACGPPYLLAQPANKEQTDNAVQRSELRQQLEPISARRADLEAWDSPGKASAAELFSENTQALEEFTFLADCTFDSGFIARAENRLDLSIQNVFFSDTPGMLEPSQTTATLGLVYWWGTKRST